VNVRYLTAIAAVLVFISAVPAASGTAQHLVVIDVKSVTVAGTVSDIPPKGPSKGDRYTGRDKLINLARQFGRPAGAVVGTDVSVLTVTGPTTGCVKDIAKLPGGTLTFEGCAHLGSGGSISVVGATGAFAGASGTMTGGSGNSPTNTFRLKLP